MSDFELGSVSIGTTGLEKSSADIAKVVEQIQKLTDAVGAVNKTGKSLSELNGIKLTSIEEQ